MTDTSDNQWTGKSALGVMLGAIYVRRPRIIYEFGAGPDSTPLLATTAEHIDAVLYSFDRDEQQLQRAFETVVYQGAKAVRGDAVEMAHTLSSLELALIDAGNRPMRLALIDILTPKLAPGGLLLVHDTHIQAIYDAVIYRGGISFFHDSTSTPPEGIGIIHR